MTWSHNYKMYIIQPKNFGGINILSLIFTICYKVKISWEIAIPYGDGPGF